MIYRLYKTNPLAIVSNAAVFDSSAGSITSFIFDPANTDYQNFKSQINVDEAQLEDADGNLMTAEEAKAFVATLP